MSQALYRTWRPTDWEQVVGQNHVIQTLKNAVRSNRVGHAYLFAGPRGTGKTTTARLLAKAVNCKDLDPNKHPCNQCEHCISVNENRFLDLIEIDAASNTSVEDVRDLRDKINFAPTQGTYKVYIIDEVHMLSTAAFNALLKTLEEPPPHAIFILATTEVHKIPATVLSRCQRHEFRRIPADEITSHLEMMALEEKMQFEQEALTLIARQATGSLRDAISMLDQLASVGETITLLSAQSILGTATSQIVIDIVDAILHKDAANGIALIHHALDGGSDARQLARQMVDYLRVLLLVQLKSSDNESVNKEMLDVMQDHAKSFKLHQLLKAIKLFNHAASELRGGWHPALLLELSIAEVIEFEQVSSPIEKITDPPPAKTNTKRSSQETPKSKSNEERQTGGESRNRPAGKSDDKTNLPAENIESTIEAQESPEVSMKLIRSHWRDIRAYIKDRSKPAEALLNSCKDIGLRENTLVLGFATDVLKSKMETKDNITLISEALKYIVQADINISCVIVSGKSEEIPPDLEIDEDGVVGTALNLGGKIVDDE